MDLSRSGYSVKAFLLILLFLIPSVEGQLYGEDSTSLGQFVDDYESTENISVAVSVIRNSTHNAIELNYTEGGSAFENFTDYTEVDTGSNRVVVQSDSWVSHLAHRDEDTYLYYDYGTDYFDDFVHTLVFEGDYADTFGLGYVWAVADGIDDINGILLSSGNALGLRIYRSSTQNLVTLVEIDGGASYAVSYNFMTANTKCYANISKDDLDLVVKLYDDSGMTNLITALSLTLHTDHKLEIIYAVNAHNDFNPDAWMNTDVYNLSIGRTSAGFASEGYFTTTDYLDYVNGSILVDMNNASIPENTGITVQYSDDNSTWVNGDGVPGYETLTDGFSSFDLRALNYSTNFFKRVNETTSDGSITPSYEQSRLITTEGEGGAGVSVLDPSFLIVGLAIGLIIGAGILLAGGKS